MTIDGGEGADFINIDSAANVTVVAGANDNISVTAGTVNFVNFVKDAVVTINGVEFKSAANTASASISFADNAINFLDGNWTGTITASDDIQVQGFDEPDDIWTYTAGSKDNSYKVNSGKLYDNVWAKVNSKGIRTGEVATGSDDTLDIEVVGSEITTKNNSILGSTGADTINVGYVNGGGISIDAGAGNDSITVNEVNNNDTLKGNVTIDGGADDDTISVGNITGSNVKVIAGEGADDITIGDVTGGGNVTVDGGEGDDTISVGTIDEASKVTVVAGTGDVVEITGGSLTAAISDGATINGVAFNGDTAANETITVGSSEIYLTGWTGTLTADDGITVYDKNGATVSGGEQSYVMTKGEFATWATVTNENDETLYIIQGNPIIGTTNDDTIKIANGVSSVEIDGQGGFDTIIAGTLTDATINTNTDADYISVDGGNIHVQITADSTINGAVFGTANEADITIGSGIITVGTYSGDVTANNLTVSDINGVKVTGTTAYTMTDGAFSTWATVSNGTGDTYYFSGETLVSGTEGNDTITVKDAENVLIDGKGGTDTINASTLTGSTINAADDIISVTSGDIYASITTASTINGAVFSNEGNAEIEIGEGIITVDGYSGNISAGSDNVTVSDNRGATVSGSKAYTMTGGEFVTWATINSGDSYAFAGDTVEDDQIVIGTIENVLIDGQGGIDNITADSLTGATINANDDNINVTEGDFLANITAASTINGATFGTAGNADVTIGSEGVISVNGYSGSITAGSALVADSNGATVSGGVYTMTSGVFEKWATINGTGYTFVGDTLAVGTDDNDTIQISSAADVSINGLLGEDTITANNF